MIKYENMKMKFYSVTQPNYLPLYNHHNVQRYHKCHNYYLTISFLIKKSNSNNDKRHLSRSIGCPCTKKERPVNTGGKALYVLIPTHISACA